MAYNVSNENKGLFGRIGGVISSVAGKLDCWEDHTVAPADVGSMVAGQQVMANNRGPAKRVMDGAWVWLKFTASVCVKNTGRFAVTFLCHGVGEVAAASMFLGRFAHAGAKAAIGVVGSDVVQKSLVGLWDIANGRNPYARDYKLNICHVRDVAKSVYDERRQQEQEAEQTTVEPTATGRNQRESTPPRRRSGLQ